MHIIFVSASIGGGGAERVVAELAAQMSEQGHRVEIVTIGSQKKDYHLPADISVINCAQKGKIPGLSFLGRVCRLRKVVKERQPDACISFNTTVNIYAALACADMGRKLILAERNDPVSYPSSKVYRFLRDRLYRGKFRYAFQTEEAKQFFSKKIQNNSAVIFNPINSAMPAVYEGQRSKRFVMAGRLEPQKNLIMAIDAFSMLKESHPEYVLEIYGEGMQKAQIEEYIIAQALSPWVKLMGRSNRLYEDILDATAFVLSSDFEGMSNSMLEAMALGIPTISTDYPSGGARAVIRNGENGLLIPVGDTQALHAAMKRVIDEPELAQCLSANGEKLRKELSVASITEQWLTFVSQE